MADAAHCSGSDVFRVVRGGWKHSLYREEYWHKYLYVNSVAHNRLLTRENNDTSSMRKGARTYGHPKYWYADGIDTLIG